MVPVGGVRLITEKIKDKIAIDTTGSITFHKNPKEVRLSRDPVSRKIRAATTRTMRNRGGLARDGKTWGFLGGGLA